MHVSRMRGGAVAGLAFIVGLGAGVLPRERPVTRATEAAVADVISEEPPPASIGPDGAQDTEASGEESPGELVPPDLAWEDPGSADNADTIVSDPAEDDDSGWATEGERPTVDSSLDPAEDPPSDTPPGHDPMGQALQIVTSGSAQCSNPAAEVHCQFRIEGLSRPGQQPEDALVFTLVSSVRPAGRGYYLQTRPAIRDASGHWSQPFSYSGSAGWPARTGDQLSVRAVMVRSDAMYDTKKLSGLTFGSGATLPPLRSFDEISGVLEMSNEVLLVVQR